MTAQKPSSPEKAGSLVPSPESSHLIVVQPEKLGNLLEAIESLTAPSEAASGRQGENGGAGTHPPQAGESGPQTISPRDQAIANLPSQEKMQTELRKHIYGEVRTLRRKAAYLTTSRPGAAYRLNQIYANIRKLNRLLLELLQASYETLKHFFVRVFIDRQPIL